MKSRFQFWLAAALFLFTLPALAGRLSDLPWDDKIPQNIREGVKSSLWKETTELTKKQNEKGRPYIRVFTTDEVFPQPDGKVHAFLTIQRCLEDKMVSERWRYTLEKKGKDFEIIGRDKLAEDQESLPVRISKPNLARVVKPFTYKHDLLNLQFEGGAALLVRVGDQPKGILLAGKGRMTLDPLNEYEGMFLERKLKTKRVDTEFTEINLVFDPSNKEFTTLLGLDPSQPDQVAPAGQIPSNLSSDLADLYNDANKTYEGKDYTPYAYATPTDEYEQPQAFGFEIKTENHGWLYYYYNPNAIYEIGLLKSKSTLSISAEGRKNWEQVLRYYAPETRKLPLPQAELRRGFRDADLLRFDGQFDIDSDRFTAIVDSEITLLIDTKTLKFGLAGNPKVRSVRLNGAQDLLFVPMLSYNSLRYGFEETANTYRVVLPEKYKAGTQLRLTVSYESPKIVYKLEQAVWWIQRGGFLPFGGTLAEHAYGRMVIRTPAEFTHVGIGSQISEEVQDNFKITEWTADRGFNFSTMLIGHYYEPIYKEAAGIKITGLQTKTQGEDAVTNSQLEPEVEEAALALGYFTDLFRVPYPFKDLKVVGTPLQMNYSQSPSSTVFVGQVWMIPESRIANYSNIDPALLRGSTSHEVAHQWWGGLVSNISEQQYWFIEILPELSSAFYLQAAGKTKQFQAKILEWRTSGMSGDWQTSLLDFDRAENASGAMLYYTKGPAVFWMLREYFSEKALLQLMRNLANLHAGDLISTSDLQGVMEKTFGEKMDWFFDQYVRNIGIPEVSYKFNAPRPAEDGKGWIITGKLRQEILAQGKAVPGKTFRHLLVPIKIDVQGGKQPVVFKEFMDTPEKEITLRLEAQPNGAPRINDGDVCYLKVKEM